MTQIEDNTPINAKAEYICFFKDGHNILVDMYDIDNILFLQDIEVLKKSVNNFYDYYDKNNFETKKLYSIQFIDHTIWQLPLDDDVVKRFENFKNKLDKQK